MTERIIGATDAAPIAGLSKYANARDVYECIVNGIEATKTPAMERGNIVEPIIRAEFARRHPEVRILGNPGVMKSKAYKFATASPDDITRDGVLIEYKSTNRWGRDNWGEPGSGDMPADYVCQVTWAMDVCGCSKAYVFTAFGEDVMSGIPGVRPTFQIEEFCLYEVPYDRDFARYLLSKGEKFWTEHIEPRVPPPMSPKRLKGKQWKQH